MQIINVTHPYTQLEVNDLAEILITGAAANGTVSVAQNGGSPYVWPTKTGSNGSWSVEATEGSSNVGTYTQTWYVNGAALTPVNPNTTYLPWAPNLPSFQVWANTTTSDCPQPSAPQSSCGAANAALYWIVTPIQYYSGQSFASGAQIAAAANEWNDAQSYIALTGLVTEYQIQIYDSSPPAGANAVTYSYGEDCNADCEYKVDECTGKCLTPSVMYEAVTQLNSTNITNGASYLGANLSSFTTFVVTHELGHGLRLADDAATSHTCSEAQSVMYPSGSVAWQCGHSSANSCDASGLKTLYGGGLPYCTPYEVDYCDTSESCS